MVVDVNQSDYMTNVYIVEFNWVSSKYHRQVQMLTKACLGNVLSRSMLNIMVYQRSCHKMAHVDG